MRLWFRTTTGILVVLAIVVAAFAGTAGAAPRGAGDQGARAGLDGLRGRLPVRDHRRAKGLRRPGGGHVSLSVIRKPATGAGRVRGSIFTNPGGPGGSGVDFLRGAAEIFAGVNEHTTSSPGTRAAPRAAERSTASRRHSATRAGR